MLKATQRAPRVRWTTRRSEAGAVSVTVTLHPRGGSPTALALRAATTPAAVIGALRDTGLSFGDIGMAVGAFRHRVSEWQRGVVGVGRTRWARLTALRDVVAALDDLGRTEPRRWLFAYNSLLDTCPYQRLVADDFTPVLDAARRAP
jgi:hypothetical protein